MCNAQCDCKAASFGVHVCALKFERMECEHATQPKLLTRNGRFKADNEIVFTLNGFCVYLTSLMTKIT